MTDLRQGVSETTHAALDVAARLHTTDEPLGRQLRILSSYAALQASYVKAEATMTVGDRYKAAIEGAGALLAFANLLSLQVEG